MFSVRPNKRMRLRRIGAVVAILMVPIIPGAAAGWLRVERRPPAGDEPRDCHGIGAPNYAGTSQAQDQLFGAADGQPVADAAVDVHSVLTGRATEGPVLHPNHLTSVSDAEK